MENSVIHIYVWLTEISTISQPYKCKDWTSCHAQLMD